MVNLDVIAELGGRLRWVLPDEPALAFAASPLVVSIFTERLETLGWPPELNVTVNLDVADGGAVGGPVAELPRLLQVAKRIWGSGWVEVMLGDGRTPATRTSSSSSRRAPGTISPTRRAGQT